VGMDRSSKKIDFFILFYLNTLWKEAFGRLERRITTSTIFTVHCFAQTEHNGETSEEISMEFGTLG
jgi:hypothetical protein